jgi:hypothetical protein
MLISSRENPLIKEASALVSDKKARKPIKFAFL